MRISASIAAASVAAALVTVTGPMASAQAAAPAFSAYHNATSQQQTERFNTLRGQGYRPITFTVDDASSPRYGAVWVRQSGPAWAMIQGMSASGYQKRFDDYLADGYRPTSVSATGSGGGAVFAAIFEKVPGKFFAKHNLTTGQFAAANADAAKRGYVLTTANVYGTADDPRYVGVWTQGSQSWSVTVGKSFDEHHAEFLARTKSGERPSLVSVAPDGTYTAVWVKGSASGWYEYTGMTPGGYQKRFDELKAKGYLPTQLDAEGGTYAAIWTKG